MNIIDSLCTSLYFCRVTAENRPSSFDCAASSPKRPAWRPLVAIQRNRFHLKCNKKGMFPITSLLQALSTSLWESLPAGHEVLENLMEKSLCWNKRKKGGCGRSAAVGLDCLTDNCRRGPVRIFFMVEHTQKIHLFRFSASGFSCFYLQGVWLFLGITIILTWRMIYH